MPDFNGDKMDNILNPDGLDWSFDKPTEGDYHTIYIIKKVEEEDDEEDGPNAYCEEQWEIEEEVEGETILLKKK